MLKINDKNSKILQFDLLLNCQRLLHGIFLRQTSQEDLEKYFKISPQNLDQIHSNLVEKAPALIAADAHYTHQTGIPLAIRHADCQAAIFYDPHLHVIALAHAGWRGQVGTIYTKVVDRLKKEFQINPANLLCAIGPSLGPEQAEFKGWQSYFPPHFAEFQIKPDYFDLRAISRNELVSLGILNHHIEIAKECTFSDSERFHSWRRDHDQYRLHTAACLL